jgi:hypothetical protein
MLESTKTSRRFSTTTIDVAKFEDASSGPVDRPGGALLEARPNPSHQATAGVFHWIAGMQASALGRRFWLIGFREQGHHLIAARRPVALRVLELLGLADFLSGPALGATQEMLTVGLSRAIG